MKQLILNLLGSAALLVASCLPAAAQGNSSPEAPKFNSIRTPTSPAFTLLGVEPSAVERPNSPSEFALSFLNRASDFKTVPEDFALEVSPYWLLNHRRLTWRDEIARTWWQSLARTATFSIATAQVGDEEAAVSGLAIGARASLFSGQLSQDTREQIKKLEALLQADAALLNAMIGTQLLELDKLVAAKQLTVEKRNEMAKALIESATTSQAFVNSPQNKARRKAVDDFTSNREGFILELASAASWRFPEAAWAAREVGRWSFWMTPAYQKSKGSMIGVLRYASKDATDNASLLDVGLRVLQSHERYAFSLEYVRRTFVDSELDARYRLVGVAEYNVFGDHWVVASFGRDHNSTDEGSLVARLGLTFNFSEERYQFADGK